MPDSLAGAACGDCFPDRGSTAGMLTAFAGWNFERTDAELQAKPSTVARPSWQMV